VSAQGNSDELAPERNERLAQRESLEQGDRDSLSQVIEGKQADGLAATNRGPGAVLDAIRLFGAGHR
jgi:hypothetical protein